MRISRTMSLALSGCAMVIAMAGWSATRVSSPPTDTITMVSPGLVKSPPATGGATSSVQPLDTMAGTAPSDVIAAVDAANIANVVVVVGNADGELYRYQKGTKDFRTQTIVASGGKLLLGTLAMRMVQANQVSLTAPASTYFGYWASPSGTDNRRTETLEYLLAQKGGFNHGILVNGCTDNGTYTLQGCAHQIYNNGLASGSPAGTHLPGQVFSYGAQDLQLAAALLENAGGGANFNTLFQTYVTGPLGMSNTQYRNTLPPYTTNPTNPYVAKNLWSTTDDYALLLTALLKGNFITNLDQMFSARTTTSQMTGFVPPSVAADGDWLYAQASWVVCHGQPASQDPAVVAAFEAACKTNKLNSSPGLYGWTPWIDRKNGYWALIAMDNENGVGATEGDTLAVNLEAQLEPLIVSHLGS